MRCPCLRCALNCTPDAAARAATRDVDDDQLRHGGDVGAAAAAAADDTANAATPTAVIGGSKSV